MSCPSCNEIVRVDAINPPCATGSCPVPPLDARAARVIELRSRVISLGALMSPADAIRALGAKLDDIEMLAEAERALKEDIDA